ncbi:MAG: S8 family serine peptidase [Myxococcota bacterium]
MSMGLAVPASIAPGETGRGILVAVIDSGINFQHPHLGIPGRGLAVERGPEGLSVRPGAHADRYGHGTCCAALVHALAPEAGLLAIRVTADRPTTDAERLARGIEVAAEAAAQILLVPLGTKTVLTVVREAVARALAQGCAIVAPRPEPDLQPGDLPGVLGVQVRDGVDVAQAGGVWVADGRARAAEGQASNFYGPSLSAARVAAALARDAQARGGLDVQGFKKTVPVL